MKHICEVETVPRGNIFKITFESMQWQGKGTDTNGKVSEPKFRVKVIAVNSW